MNAELIRADASISLELIADKHARPLLDLLDANRIHLRKWLPWVDNMQTVEDFQAYTNRSKVQHEEGTDFGYVILVNGIVAGRIGIHYIHQHNRNGAIGYWLGQDFTGQGTVTKACYALIDYCFNNLGLNRIEIKCATENYKSAAIPERLKFTKEGVLRQAELVNGEFLDLNLYSMLKDEWKNL